MEAPASSEAAAAVTPPAAEALPEAPRRRAGGQKRKSAANSSTSAPKRLIKERNALHPLPPLSHNGPVTRARQSPNKLAAAAAAAAAALHNPPSPAPSPAVEEARGKDAAAAGDAMVAEEEEPIQQEEPVVDEWFDAIRSRGSGVHAVPTPAGWFSWNSIHPIEKHMMPSFFSGKSDSRTPDIYMEIRNFIMRKFHTDPQTQLELKDLSEISVGDTSARQEVMEFLDHWGLINFHPFPPSCTDTGVSNAGEASEASSLIEKLYRFETVQTFPRFVSKKAELSAPPVPSPSLLPESAISDDSARNVGPSVEYHCNSCSADCSRKRYHCPKQADFDLCTECYNDGKFGSGMSATDFILMEPADVPGVCGGSWTDQETLLLLEALELFGENWNEIAEHVATKTKAQCMLHFIQMPIEDTFLEGKEDNDDNIQENKDSSIMNKESASANEPEIKEIVNTGDTDKPVPLPGDALKEIFCGENEGSSKSSASIAVDALKTALQAVGIFPEGEHLSFTESGNPVMALAAFLAGLVEPDVANTSFRSSLKATSEDVPGIQLATRHCFLLEDPPNDVKDTPASEIAIAVTGIEEVQKEEVLIPMANENNVSKDCIDKNEDSVSVEKEMGPSISSQDCGEKSHAGSELGDAVPAPEGASSCTKDLGEPSLAGGQVMPSAIKDSGDLSLGGEEVIPIGFKDSGDLSLAREEVIPTASKDSGDLSLAGEEVIPAAVKDSGDLSLVGEQVMPTAIKDSGDLSLPGEQVMPTAIKDSGDASLAGEQVRPTAIKDSGDVSLTGEKIMPAAIKDPDDASPKGEQIIPTAIQGASDSAVPMVMEQSNIKYSVDLPLQGDDAPSSAKEIGNSNMEAADKSISLKESEDTSNATDNIPTSSPVEGEAQYTAGTDSAVENGEKAGDTNKATTPSDEKNCASAEFNGDDSINRVKRAALTALSAATVKAKLLADQEEDQIRQLVSLVIEKQLHKLETKLALYTDMESMNMRVKEQIDRARQRLLHERAQIVAARLGLPTSSLPTSKVALGYGSTVLRPPTMSSLKPPYMRRP